MTIVAKLHARRIRRRAMRDLYHHNNRRDAYGGRYCPALSRQYRIAREEDRRQILDGRITDRIRVARSVWGDN